METFGHYHLEQVVGRGAMGEVFRAHDTRHERTVALKRLRPEFTGDAGYQERFRRESRLAARLTSPHVVPIHDFGEIDGQLYLDMRLVDGPDLAEVLDRDGPLAPDRAVEVVRHVADALDDAHTHDLVHRDVKPSNVLLTVRHDRPFAYLVDFGIVRGAPGTSGAGLTAAGAAPGTPAYMAPELFTGDPEAGAGRAGDVYALGCLLVALLTGHPPFRRSGPGLMYDHVNTDPPAPSVDVAGVPPALDAVVAGAMAKAPGDRFRSAGDLAEAAGAALRSRPAPVGGASESRWATTPAGSPFAAPGMPAAPTPRWDSGPQALGGPAPWATGPPTGSGWTGGPPSWGNGPPTLLPPPPPRRRGLVVAIVAGALALLVAAVVTVVVVTRGSAPVPAAAGPAAGPAVTTPNSTPPTTTPPSTTTAPVRGVVSVFPDITDLGPGCYLYTPAEGEYVTTSGQRATAVYDCDRSDLAPGARVVYIQWPSPAAAREWYDDTVAEGSPVSTDTEWSINSGTRQGPIRYWRNPSAVLITGGYDDRSYTFDISADNLDQARAVFRDIPLRPASEIAG